MTDCEICIRLGRTYCEYEKRKGSSIDIRTKKTYSVNKHHNGSYMKINE